MPRDCLLLILYRPEDHHEYEDIRLYSTIPPLDTSVVIDNAGRFDITSCPAYAPVATTSGTPHVESAMDAEQEYEDMDTPHEESSAMDADQTYEEMDQNSQSAIDTGQTSEGLQMEAASESSPIRESAAEQVAEEEQGQSSAAATLENEASGGNDAHEYNNVVLKET